MPGASYPSIGLKFDIPEVVAHQAAVEKVRGSYRGLAGDIASAQKASKGVLAATAADSAAASAAAKSSATDQSDSFKKILAEARASMTTRVAMTRQMFGEETAEADAAARAQQTIGKSTLDFRVRMMRQQATEAQLAANAEVAAFEAARSRDAASAAAHQALLEQMLYDRVVLSQRLAQAEADAHAEMVAREVADQAAADALIEQMQADVVQRQIKEYEAARLASKVAADAEVADAAKVAASRAKVLDQIEAEATRAGLSRSEYAALRAEQAGLTAEAAPFIARLKQAEEELGHTSGSALKVRESLVVVREGLRGDFTRMAGSVSILAQAFGLLKFATNPVVLGILAVVAAIGTMIFATEEGAREQANLQNALELTGFYAGQTAGQIQAAAQKVADATNTGIGSANKVLLTLVQSGEVTGDTLDLMADAAVRFADKTHESATKAATDLLKVIEDPVKGIEDLNNHYHFLSQAQDEHIRLLVEEGDKTTAAHEAMKIFDDRLKEETTHMSGLEAAIRGVTNAIGEMWAKLKSIDQQPATAVRIAADQAFIKAHQGDPLWAGNVQIMQADLGAAQAQQRAEMARAAQSKQDKIATDAANDLHTQLTSLKTNQQKVEDEVTRAQHNADLILGNPALNIPATPPDRVGKDAMADALFTRNNPAIVRQRIQNKYAGGLKQHTPSMAGPENSIARVTAQVAGLRAALEAVSGDPLSEFAAKLQKAGDVAGAAFSHGKATGFQDTASALAEQKEFLTLTLQMAEASAKEQRQAEDAVAIISLQAQAQRDSNAAMDDYLNRGGGAAALIAAQEKQAEIQQAATHTQNDLTEAQKSGVSSTDDIAAAVLRALGPTHQITEAEREAARILQERAKAAVAAKDAQADLTEAEKRLAGISAAHTATLQSVRDLEDYTAALNAGAEALIAYRLAQAVQARAGANPLPAGSSPGQQADYLAQITSDEALKKAKEIANTQALALHDVSEQERLALETSRERQTDADAMLEAERVMLTYRAQGKTISLQEALIVGRTVAEANQARRDVADLEKQIQDTIRDTFVKSGKLDFTSLRQGVSEALRKAIYDNFLAKPIDIVVNALVNFETQALQSAISSIFNGGGSGGGGFGSFLSSIFGGGSGVPDGNTLGDLPHIGDAISSTSSQLGGLASSLSSFAAAAGPVIAVAMAEFAVAGPIAKMFGADKQQQQNASIGAALLGIPGAILGVLFGGKESNHGALANFDQAGNFVGVTGDKATADTTSAVTQIAQSTASFIDQLKAVGIDAAGIIKQIDLGTRDPTHIRLANGQTIDTKMGDAQALQDGIEKALLSNAKYTDSHEQALVQQMIAANASLDSITKALQDYVNAQQAVKDVNLGLLKYTNPTQYAIQTTIAQQIARRDQLKSYINSGYYTQDQINGLASTLPELEKNELADALSQLATSASGAAHSLGDIQTEQKKILDYVTSLTTGSLSPLSPEAILGATGSQFFSDVTSAKGGNFDALSGLTNDAQGYLGAAKSFYGSSGAYAAIFQTVQDALTSVGNASITIDAGSQAIVDAIAQLQQAVKDAGDEIVGAINDNTATTGAAGEAIVGGVGDVATQVGGGNAANFTANLLSGGVLA